MYIMYVDESGDPGFNSPTDHYILSAFVVKDTSWTEVLRHLIDMRRQLKRHFGFPIRAELKGSGLIDPRRLPSHKRVIFQNVGKRNVRVALYKHYMQSLCDLHIIVFMLISQKFSASIKNIMMYFAWRGNAFLIGLTLFSNTQLGEKQVL